MGINWDSPEERLGLIERVGVDEYNRLIAQHQEDSIVDRVAGHPIRTVGSRYGRLYAVGGTNMAFPTMEAARQYALNNPAPDFVR